jgi:hypothetical protein
MHEEIYLEKLVCFNNIGIENLRMRIKYAGTALFTLQTYLNPYAVYTEL